MRTILMKTSMALMILAFLAGCVPGEIVAPVGDSPTSTPALVENTPVPSATPTPEATATPTTEPTKSPAQIAAGLEGLNQERDYIVQGNYLVDTYNGAKKAVMENNSWRALDYENTEEAEIMYGHLVPKEIDYLQPELTNWSDGSVSAGAQMIYLGEILWQKEEYKGGEIDMAYLLTGLRDKNGVLHIIKRGADAPEAEQPHWYYWGERDTNGALTEKSCRAFFREMVESECWIEPGDIIIDYRILNPSNILQGVKAIENKIYPLSNSAFRVVNAELFNQNKDRMMTQAEWEMILEGEWPDRVVDLYPLSGPSILTSAMDWN